MITHGTCLYESTQQLSLPSKHVTLGYTTKLNTTVTSDNN